MRQNFGFIPIKPKVFMQLYFSKLMTNYTLLSCVESTIIEPRELYGRFALGNFTKGQSLTVANALRRGLLSQLIGCAICFVEIKGINHEYESLPGVKEGVLDLLLNFRQITLKSNIEFFNSQLAYLNVSGPGIIRARDLKLPYFLSVVDPNQPIATLSPGAQLVIKLLINCGKTYVTQTPGSLNYENQKNKLRQRSWFNIGYPQSSGLTYSSHWLRQRNTFGSTVKTTNKTMASTESLANEPVDSTSKNFNHTRNRLKSCGYFPINAIFAPVLKVNYTIEPVTKKKEKIYFEIWTNGSIEPRQAIHRAAKTLIELFLPLQGFPNNLPIDYVKQNQTVSEVNQAFHFDRRFALFEQPIGSNIENHYTKTMDRIELLQSPRSTSIASKKLDSRELDQRSIQWLKSVVKANPELTLKIVKAVLKPKTLALDFKSGVIQQGKVLPLNNLSPTEKLFDALEPTAYYDSEQRLIVKSNAKIKPSLKKTKAKIKPMVKQWETNRKQKKSSSKRHLTKIEKRKLNFQLGLYFFKQLIVNVELSQLQLPYKIYSTLKTYQIHNIEQLIVMSTDQLSKILSVKTDDLKIIQTSLKNYVIARLL